MTSSFTVRPGSLALPGAELYYESAGSGPLLLCIPGGPQDAGVFADLAQHLAAHYTVVAHDPRGNSRSLLTGRPEEQRVEEHARDAAQLISAWGRGPARVFGTSGGAQIGLELTRSHPDLVDTLIAHEPPCAWVLDDPHEVLDADRAVYETYRREGVEAGMRQFFGDNGLDQGADDPQPPAPGPEAAATFARVMGNFDHFLAHGLLPLTHYRPDVAALRTGPSSVRVAVGRESAGQDIDRIGRALAGQLGTEPVLLPGGHTGYADHPAEFAADLHRAFAAR